MISLTETSQKFKRLFLPIAFILIVLIFVGLIWLRLNAKNKPAPTPTTEIQSPKINSIPRQSQPQAFDTAGIATGDLPESLPILTAHKYSIDQSFAQQIAGILGIKDQPKKIYENTPDGKQFLFSENNKVLTISQSTISYKDYAPETTIKSYSEAELKNLSLTFLKKLPLSFENITASNQPPVYLNLKREDYSSTPNFVTAQAVEFHFDYVSDGQKILGQTTENSLVTIEIDKNGQVHTLNAHFFKSFEKAGDFKLKNQQEALQELTTKKATIVRVYIPDENGQALELFRTQPQNITTIQVGELKSAYFLSTANPNIQPVYVFLGDFRTQKGENGKVELYLPAIKS